MSCNYIFPAKLSVLVARNISMWRTVWTKLTPISHISSLQIRPGKILGRNTPLYTRWGVIFRPPVQKVLPHFVLDSLHGRLLLSDTPRAWETFESWIEDVPERHGQYFSVKYSDVKGSFYYRYRPQRLGMGWRWCGVPLWRWQPLWWMEVREREI